MFLFAIPAGALADIVDRRRFLIGAESFITLVSTLFAVMVWLNLITPGSLLLFTFLVEAGSAATSPGWQSVVADLVPHEDLGPALAMNSVGVNISRAVGPVGACKQDPDLTSRPPCHGPPPWLTRALTAVRVLFS